MNIPTISLRAVVLCAIALSVDMPDRLQAGYLGCAEQCNGSYCWGSASGPVGCMETFMGCVVYSTSECPPK